jgi:DNA-directed RNA polymerase specialized sigma subunit
MAPTKPKTLRNTGIDKSAQAGNSRSEDKLILIYASYVNFMVRQYSKKTEIKEDDDLRSYVNQGLLDGIRKFDPKRGSKFIYFAHMDEENIFLGGVIQVY